MLSSIHFVPQNILLTYLLSANLVIILVVRLFRRPGSRIVHRSVVMVAKITSDTFGPCHLNAHAQNGM